MTPRDPEIYRRLRAGASRKCCGRFSGHRQNLRCYVAYNDYTSAIAMLEAVQINCNRAYELF